MRQKWSSQNTYLPYANNVYVWMRKVELSREFLPNITTIQRQQDVNYRMRLILVDWLISIHHKFQMAPETIFICVNILDRFLMRRLVTRQRLQLLGVTAIYIASKYQEIDPPPIVDFVYMTDGAVTSSAEVLAMEFCVLQELEYNFTFPTSLSFLETYMQVIKCTDLSTEQFTMFILDLSLGDLNL